MVVLNAFRHQRFNTWNSKSNTGLESLLCSTPFGIRDSTHNTEILPKPVIKVLNAFRHQRFNTICITTLCALRFGAQRLSASEIQHTCLQQLTTLPHSAQRLSASEIQHFLALIKTRIYIICAQRLSASEIQHWRLQSPNQYIFMCSTPFGIRDSTHTALKVFPCFKSVLNAFRHQRFNTSHLFSDRRISQ